MDQPWTGHSDEEFARLSTLWNILYHVYIPHTDLVSLQKQSRNLMELATSAASWSSSKYGNWIRFLDEDTRSRVCNVWSQYAKTETFTRSEKQRFDLRGRKGFTGLYDTKIPHMSHSVGGARSAGAQAVESVETMSTAFKQYWKTGVVGGIPEDVLALGDDGKGRMNPMFAISSASNGDFALHYGRDPLLGFHLVEAFDGVSATKEAIKNVVALAKSQFRKWCISFFRWTEESRIRLVLCSEEVVRLCYTLQSHLRSPNSIPQITRLYKNVWSSVALHISPLDEA